MRGKGVSIRKTEQLVPCRTTTAVCRDDHMRHINCVTNIQIFVTLNHVLHEGNTVFEMVHSYVRIFWYKKYVTHIVGTRIHFSRSAYWRILTNKAHFSSI
jgi:hypothetical protein